MAQAASANQIIQNMPELSGILDWDKKGPSRERMERAASLIAEAGQLYGTQTGRYKLARLVGGSNDPTHQRNRSGVVASSTAGIMVFLGLGMAVNIIGRSIYNKSFTHIKTWYKRYLKILATPPAIGIAIALTHKWADNKLKDVKDKPHQEKWKDISPEEVRKSGLYQLMDREQFILAHTLKGLCTEEWAVLAKAVRTGGKVDEIKKDVDAAQKELRKAAKAAYIDGCYRIHCAHLTASQQTLPLQASFTTSDMRMPY